MKRWMMAAFAVAALSAMPLWGNAAQAARDDVTVGMRLEPPGLDPTTGAAAAISQITLYNVYEGLTKINNDGKVEPLLAKSWEVSDDNLTWTFHLVKGVKFHDGSDFDASDVKFTFERNQGKNSQNKRKERFDNMASIETPDPYTVVIRLKRNAPDFLFGLGESTAVIVDPASAATNATKPVGTGPFKFVKWIKGDSVTLEKFPGYRNADKIRLNKVVFRFINDAAAQVAALKAGDIDVLPIGPAPETLADFEADPNFVVLKGTTNGETILAMNHANKALADERVRKAIQHAIDRQALIDGAMYGYGVPIGSHFAPHHPAYIDLTGVTPYDPDKARALLKEAGYGNGLKLSLKLPPPLYARRGGEIVAAMLADVGIEAKIENVEWAQWIDKVYKKRQYDLTIVSHVEPMDIGIYAKDDYYFNYKDPAFKAIMEKADSAPTPEARTAALQEAQRYLAEHAVNGFLFQLAKTPVMRKGLKGIAKDSHLFANDMSVVYWEE